MYYRCELTFDGEPQNVGFLHELDAALGINEETLSLYEIFNELNAPRCEGQVQFWFTEKGYQLYKEHIDILCSAINDTGIWGVMERIANSLPEQAVVYRDEYQIALRKPGYGS